MIFKSLGKFRGPNITSSEVVSAVLDAMESTKSQDLNCWIHVQSREELLDRAIELDRLKSRRDDMPLFSVPFAVKDNLGEILCLTY